MSKARTVRRIIRAERPPTGHGHTLEHVAEKRVILDPDGGITEYEITQGFACGCSRDSEIGLRCTACQRLHCSNCRNIGVTLSSVPYCGGCSRVIVDRLGRVQRVPRVGYGKVRLKRMLGAFLHGCLSVFIERENRQ